MKKNDTIEVPKFAMAMLTRKGYFDRYFSHKSEGNNSRKSYELTEDELFKYFNLNRYTSFASFTNSKNRSIRNKKK